MPSFAFWKSSKTGDIAHQPLLAADTTPDEPKASSAIVPKNLDLDPGNEDSGVFLFDEADMGVQQEKVMEIGDLCTREESVPSASEQAAEQVDPSLGTSAESHLLSSVPEQTIETDPKDSSPVVTSTSHTTPNEQMSEVDIGSNNSHTPSSRPPSFTVINHALSKAPSVSSKHAVPTPQPTESLARLRRPAELNLDNTPTALTPCTPHSELEQRHALIRNSKTQSKAALRSPTKLLEERLNQLTPNKDHQQRTEAKARVFTPPPRTPENGCWIPGPGAQSSPFTSSSIRACTEAGKRPAWWCKFDKLVVFDGMRDDGHGHVEMRTRTSKGLSIARRRGDLESIVIPLGCAHCQDMLKRHEWKYDMRVCKRSVCWECRERCRWEWDEEQRQLEADKAVKPDGSRYRADSVLHDE